jgi:hypothetical protein
MTSFSDKLLWLSPMTQREAGYPKEGLIDNGTIDKCETVVNKIQNSICFILEVTYSFMRDY